MQKKIFINDLPVVVSNSVLCSLLNISKQTFQQWQQHASFPKDAKVKHGFYDLQRVIEFRDIYIYDDAEIEKEIQRQKLKYQTARSERERLETDRLSGTLIEREKMRKGLVELGVTMKDALLLLPKIIPPSLPVDHATQKILTVGLKKEIYRILNIVASGAASLQRFIQENQSNEKKEAKKIE